MHAYEMAYGRGMPMRWPPMRDTPMRWPCEKYVYERRVYERHAYERHAYGMVYIGHTSHKRTSLDRRAAPIWHTSHRHASLTGVQLSQGMHITGFQILALTAKLTQTVPPALRTPRQIAAHVFDTLAFPSPPPRALSPKWTSLDLLCGSWLAVYTGPCP